MGERLGELGFAAGPTPATLHPSSNRAQKAHENPTGDFSIFSSIVRFLSSNPIFLKKSKNITKKMRF